MTELNMLGHMAMCMVLTDGNTYIYLDNGDTWIEPCSVEIHSNNKISFCPLQIFGESFVMEPIHERHIICKYVPEPGVENAYRDFLSGYFKDREIKKN